MKPNVAWVVAAYFGQRRYEHPDYQEDRLTYIRSVVASWKRTKAKPPLILVSNWETASDPTLPRVTEAVSKWWVEGVQVYAIHRLNLGMSYGIYSDVAKILAATGVDNGRVILTEDDYVPQPSNWDAVLRDAFEALRERAKPDVPLGWLGGYVRHDRRRHELHDGLTLGLLDGEAVKQQVGLFGDLSCNLTPAARTSYIPNEKGGQVAFTNRLLKSGWAIADMLDVGWCSVWRKPCGTLIEYQPAGSEVAPVFWAPYGFDRDTSVTEVVRRDR